MDNKYSACTSFLAGKAATADGSTIIARNEDAKSAWPKHFTVHPHDEAANTEFKSSDNQFTMPLPPVRGKYTATPEWTTEFGLFEEDGINEYGVAMSATESAYTNNRVLGYDPLVENGIGEEAMVTVTLPYIKSAREGVKYLGAIIEKYGTNETNGILFSDANEVWYMETAGGHQWVAQRIPDDSYAVVSNQLSIQEVDFEDPENFMFKADLKQFVAMHHLNPNPTSFNFRNIFGLNDLSDEYYNTPRVWEGQRILNPEIIQSPVSHDLPFIRKASRLIQIEDVQQILSSHYEGTPYNPVGTGSEAEKHRFRPISLPATQESHILQIKPNQPIEVGGIHWLAMGVAAQSVYVPFFAGMSETPEMYHHGAKVYTADSAYWVFKLASVLTDAHYKEFVKELNTTRSKVNIQMRNQLHDFEQRALELSDTTALEELLNQAGNEISTTAIQAFQALSANLITKSTDLSPLYYQHNEEL
ncbi:C69 family dipeptidase [Pediococcus pentosaceus]|uniref:C69 family dipeptidase n=1 Tax=Pediococcus pentosaceus TaxID=1255 RepID=UPI0012FA9AD2|nr:C69 family dipeptidase [Pediococcus pentosaceus]WFC01787.1 C69 family dipeptidase [Pediococcus pentosaceus]